MTSGYGYPTNYRYGARGGYYQSGGSAPMLVQQKVATTADASDGSENVSFDVPTTAGNSVIVCMSFLDTLTFTLDPTFGEAMTQAITETIAGVKVYIYYLHNCGDSGNLTYRLDLPGRASVNMSEWSGLANAVPEDTSISTNAGSTTLAVVPATLDPTSGKNLVIGIGGYVNVADAYSSGPTNSFIRLTQTGGASVFQECAYLARLGDHSAVTSNVTLGSSLSSATCAAAFGGS